MYWQKWLTALFVLLALAGPNDRTGVGHRPKKVLHSGLLMHCDSMAPFGGAVTCDTCASFDPAGGVAMKLAHDVTLVQVSAARLSDGGKWIRTPGSPLDRLGFMAL
jgi:hypothetical protein